MPTDFPRLRRFDKATFTAHQTRVERLNKQYDIDGVDEILWTSVFERMDGTRSIEDLCLGTSVSEKELTELIENLHIGGLISIPDASSSQMSGADFWNLHNDYCHGWMNRIALHPLWPALTSGLADRAVAVGFVIEKYHYIEAAHEHMALAVAHADQRIWKLLSRHFQEEYNHGEIYLSGLSSLLPKESIVNSMPLPSTRALINFLNELAQSDSLAYYSANEFLQKTENCGDGDSDYVEAFYEAIERSYSLPAAICNAMKAHTRVDQDLGHSDVFFDICNQLNVITREQANRYLSATRRVVDHLEYFLDGIQLLYSARPYFPRPRSSMCNV